MLTSLSHFFNFSFHFLFIICKFLLFSLNVSCWAFYRSFLFTNLFYFIWNEIPLTDFSGALTGSVPILLYNNLWFLFRDDYIIFIIFWFEIIIKLRNQSLRLKKSIKFPFGKNECLIWNWFPLLLLFNYTFYKRVYVFVNKENCLFHWIFADV